MLARTGLPGSDIKPQLGRHTAASLAVSQGASALALRRMLGHDKPSTTLDFYADLFDDDLDDVATRLDSARTGFAADWLRNWGSGGPGRLREEACLTCVDIVPSAGHVEDGNVDDLRSFGGRLVIQAEYPL